MGTDLSGDRSAPVSLSFLLRPADMLEPLLPTVMAGYSGASRISNLLSALAHPPIGPLQRWQGRGITQSCAEERGYRTEPNWSHSEDLSSVMHASVSLGRGMQRHLLKCEFWGMYEVASE